MAAQAAADLADNVAGDISAADVRGMAENTVDSLVVYQGTPPVAYNSAGEAGTVSVDGDYLYFHNGTRWFRVRADSTQF